MTRHPIVVSGHIPIGQIQNILRKHNIWSVIIGNSHRYIGIVIKSDLKHREKYKSPTTPAYAIMSKNFFTIDPDEGVEVAISLLYRKNINGLPVVKNGTPFGIISKYDIREKYWKKSYFTRLKIAVSSYFQSKTSVIDRAIINHNFDVALSFSGEYRKLVEEIAFELKAELGKDSVFYDNFYKAHLAQPNLDLLLQKIYKNNSKLNVIFLSSDYEDKEWCGIEFRAIRELIKTGHSEKILLLKLADVNVAGLFSIDGYLDIRKMKPSEIVTHIIERSQGFQ